MKVLRGETKGWRNHPAVLMWRDYQPALYEYGRIVCVEWRERGFVDNLYDIFPRERIILPKWLGDMRLHLSHQSNLIRKLPEHYRQHFPEVEDNLPYFWVSKEKEYNNG
jgi:hypothetical protein